MGFLKVCRKRILLPNGFRIRLDMIEHPGAILVVPFLSRDKIVLLRQFRPVINKYIFELPAGTLEDDESAVACARREMIEETGYKAEKLMRLGCIYPVPGYSTEKIFIYKAEGLKRVGSNIQKDEVIRARITTRKEVCSFFNSGRIIDAKTICAFAFCGWL
jgi:ADP-ribose pyrophosphatase